MATTEIQSSINQISEIQAITMKDNYLNFATNAETGNGGLIALFQKGASAPYVPLYGYRINIDDFITMVSYPGVMQWQLRFGYTPAESSPDPQEGSYLQLIMTGTDNNGNPMTPHFQPSQQIETQPTFNPSAGNGDFKNHQVPAILEGQWQAAYSNLLSNNEMNTSFMLAPDRSQRPLNGYNMDLRDFINDLFMLNMDDTSAFVDIILVNHARAVESGQQNNTPGKIGIVLQVYASPNNSLNYYDISKPCPPTC